MNSPQWLKILSSCWTRISQNVPLTSAGTGLIVRPEIALQQQSLTRELEGTAIFSDGAHYILSHSVSLTESGDHITTFRMSYLALWLA